MTRRKSFQMIQVMSYSAVRKCLGSDSILCCCFGSALRHVE
uniref:Uncharacterized protein n=1 Tax=Anguilla anguilla TaxID=7936 RepID=A0A0E9QX76_ANGAN